MVRLFLGGLLAAIALFGWGTVYWTTLAMSVGLYGQHPEEDRVVQAIQQGDLQSGTYFIPMPDTERLQSDDKYAREFERRHVEGPLIQIIYRKEGTQPMSPTIMVGGFVHFFACALLAGFLLQLASPGLANYWGRVGFVLLLGVFASALMNLSDVIWFHHPWGMPLFRMGFAVTSWLLAGLVLGAIIRPRGV